jgi:hypothetical protein
VDVLSSRILLRPGDLDRSRRCYRDALGLASYREFGPPDDPGVVFFLGPGLLEVSGHTVGPPGHAVMIWIQVRVSRLPLLPGPPTATGASQTRLPSPGPAIAQRQRRETLARQRADPNADGTPNRRICAGEPRSQASATHAKNRQGDRRSPSPCGPYNARYTDDPR